MTKAGGRAESAAPGVIRQEFSISTPPASAETSPDEKLSFWEHLYAVPENDWWSGDPQDDKKGFKVYLYDHEVPRSPYLALIVHPFEIEWIKQQYGGGLYRAQLNDPTGRIISKEIFAINGEAKRKPPTSVQAAPPAAVPAQDSALAQMVELIRENNRANRELLSEFMSRDRGYTAPPAAPPASNPMELMKPVLEGVVGMFKSMIPQPSNPLDDLIKLKQLMGEPKDVFTELTKFKELGLIGGNAGGGDLLKQLEVVFAVVEKLGIGGGGSKSVLEVIADKGPEMLGKIVSGIGEYRALEEQRLKTAQTVLAVQRGAQAVPAQAATQPGPQPVPNLPRPPAAAGPPVATQLDVQPISGAGPTQGEAVAEFTEAQLNQIKAQIVQSISNGESGQDIFGFLKISAPIFLNGMLVVDEKKQKVTGVVTPDQLAMFCANDPILSQATNLPRFRDAISELLDEVRLATMGDGQDEDLEVG